MKELPETTPFLKDVAPSARELYRVDGKQYGVAYELGMVGFWYNKELFAKAGVKDTPETWGELLAVVRQLKAAGVVPIALGGAEKWPAHFKRRALHGGHQHRAGGATR